MAGLIVVVLNLAAAAAYPVAVRAFVRGFQRQAPLASALGEPDLPSTLSRRSRALEIGAASAASPTALESASLLSIFLNALA